MLNLGTVRPGSTQYFPFESFAGSTGAPITMTGFALSDIKIYKDGGTTERASTSGFTLLDTDGIDFDGITGIHGFSVDLSDNTTADFYQSGSKYFIVISVVTIDSQTMSFLAGMFRIGYPDALLNTFIATLASQTSFTLNGGPAENDALKDMWAQVHNAASGVQQAMVQISAYTGSTKTVTLAAAPTFTLAAKDNISVMGPMPMQPATTGRKPVVDASGLVDANMVKVGPTGSGTVQTAGDIPARLPAALTTNGNMKSSLLEFISTALSEGATGRIAAAWQKAWNVSSSVWTSADVIQTSVQGADNNVILANGTYGNAALKTAIDNINNLSALANLFGSAVMTRPASGSIVYKFFFVVKNEMGQPVDVDTNTVTLTAANGSGTDRSANLSSVTHSATGEYTFTYTVSSAHADEGIVITAAGTVLTVSRKGYYAGEVADADSLAALAAIQSQTDKLLFDGSNYVKSSPQTGVTVATNGDKTGYTLTAAYDLAKTAAQAGDAMTLTSGERTTLAGVIWNALTSGLTTAGSIGKYLLDHLVGTLLTGNHNPQGGDAYARLGAPAGASVSADIAAVKAVDDAVRAKTDNLPGTPASTTNITGGTITTVTNLTNAPTAGDLTAVMKASVTAAVPSAAAIDTQLSGTHGSGTWGSADAGSGANTVTITVNDGNGHLLQNATVTLAINASRYTAPLTGTDGVAVLNPTEGDSSYNVRIKANGYQFTPVDLVVSGDTSHTYSMTQLTITPSDPGKVTLFSPCYDENNELAEGVIIKLQQTQLPASLGIAGRTAVRSAASNVSGIAEFINGLPGATYIVSRGSNPAQTATVTIPDDATDPYQLPSISGSP